MLKNGLNNESIFSPDKYRISTFRKTGFDNARGNSEVDVPLIYSDYYFLEALVRAKRLEEGKSIIPSYAGYPAAVEKLSDR